jgi:hypothetical protein
MKRDHSAGAFCRLAQGLSALYLSRMQANREIDGVLGAEEGVGNLTIRLIQPARTM